MRELSVAFLWHLHQPQYYDPVRKMFSMPWVRLHAVKAYYDMAALADKYPEMHLTFNFVPSLAEQIEMYLGGTDEYDLELSRLNPHQLNDSQKEALLSRFFQGYFEYMIKPYPRFVELMQLRGINGTRMEILSALNKFAAQDYLDLQVLFNLAWFGFTAFEEIPELRKLQRKGRFFTIEDRNFVLDKQFEIMGKIIPFYRRLWQENKIDITVSPFYHPILPLLVDVSIGRKGMQNCIMPVHPFSYPQDADRQVRDAMDYCENRFGKRPAGMWPSEGSVSPEALEIMKGAGVEWSASDEEILARSVKGFNRNIDTFHPWEAHGIGMFFRDHGLSDQIGFVYSHNPAYVAVDDFVGKLLHVAEEPDSSPRIVSIILDGENPWEYYHGSGREFLELLYERILSEPKLRPVSFTDFLREFPPQRHIRTIYSGSWINWNFDTWICDQEEADAWDALRNARELLTKKVNELDEQSRTEAWRQIFRAEGSDWFWWYGDDHSSPNDPEFDRLFRAHLERIYQILNVPPPEEVTDPILKKQLVRADVEPTGIISPVIDGKVTTFYEWLSAGWLPSYGPGGVMGGRQPFLSSIYYGFDLEKVYFRFDFEKTSSPRVQADWKIGILFDTDSGEKHKVEFTLNEPSMFTVYRYSRGDWTRKERRRDISVGRIAEIGISFKDLGVSSGMKVEFMVLIWENEIEYEHWPPTGIISFIVPDEHFQSMMWQV